MVFGQSASRNASSFHSGRKNNTAAMGSGCPAQIESAALSNAGIGPLAPQVKSRIIAKDICSERVFRLLDPSRKSASAKHSQNRSILVKPFSGADETVLKGRIRSNGPDQKRGSIMWDVIISSFYRQSCLGLCGRCAKAAGVA